MRLYDLRKTFRCFVLNKNITSSTFHDTGVLACVFQDLLEQLTIVNSQKSHLFLDYIILSNLSS